MERPDNVKKGDKFVFESTYCSEVKFGSTLRKGDVVTALRGTLEHSHLFTAGITGDMEIRLNWDELSGPYVEDGGTDVPSTLIPTFFEKLAGRSPKDKVYDRENERISERYHAAVLALNVQAQDDRIALVKARGIG